MKVYLVQTREEINVIVNWVAPELVERTLCVGGIQFRESIASRSMIEMSMVQWTRQKKREHDTQGTQETLKYLKLVKTLNALKANTSSPLHTVRL